MDVCPHSYFQLCGYLRGPWVSFTYSLSYNLTPPISPVLIGQHLIFCSLTSPTCCNLPRKYTPVKYKKKQKARFPIITKITSLLRQMIRGECHKRIGTPAYLSIFEPFLTHERIFFLIGIHSMQGWTVTTRHGVTRKRSTKKITAYRKSIGTEFYSLAVQRKKLLT